MRFLRASFCGANFNCLPAWLFQPVRCFWVRSLKAISWIVNSIIQNLKQIVKFKFLVHNFFRCLKMASYAAYVYGWIAWGWEAHFCNYRHYVSQCPVRTLNWLPNFPHKAWVDPGKVSFTCQVQLEQNAYFCSLNY